MNIMRLVTIAFAAIVISLLFTQSAVAQHSRDDSETKWKKGMVRLNKAAYAGNVRLTNPMYHVKHITEGERHFLIFRQVSLSKGYSNGLMWAGKEVARVECRVEPVEKSRRNTKVILTKSDDRTPSIESIQIAGEKVRHVLINPNAAKL